MYTSPSVVYCARVHGIIIELAARQRPISPVETGNLCNQPKIKQPGFTRLYSGALRHKMLRSAHYYTARLFSPQLSLSTIYATSLLYIYICIYDSYYFMFCLRYLCTLIH